jgi:hypothetical protein
MSAGLKHLSAVLKIVSVYNAEKNLPCPEGILVPLAGGWLRDVLESIRHAERTKLIEDAVNRKFRITAAGGDHMEAERSGGVPMEALAVHSDGDIN